MIIDADKCIGCATCADYCPVGAIAATENKTARGKSIFAVELDLCVECGNCLRSAACPTGALKQQPLEWPRSIRSAFSNPQTEHKSKDMGRGTEEMKTNEITHRFVEGQVGIAVELGRPLVGATFRDVEKVTKAVAALDVEFEEGNPCTALIQDRSQGMLLSDVLDEKVLSTIVEFKVREERIPEVLETLRRVALTVDTVFSVGIIAVVADAPGRIPKAVERAGFRVRPNGKMNLGLGRALQE
jgi:NAD-dependent dihydropyrimidine dehydrogenase PreA subunit